MAEGNLEDLSQYVSDLSEKVHQIIQGDDGPSVRLNSLFKIAEGNCEAKNISELSEKVHKIIQEDNGPSVRLKGLMKKLNKDIRKKVVSYSDDHVSNPPLFVACWLGKVGFVEYLIDECGADIEQKGIYEVEEDQSKHNVTPLWCAAVSDRLDVVKSLTERKADVNSPSDTKSTPVRSACYMTNIDCIKYLVEHGADIHKPNINGGTCLINAVQSSELCKYLIEKGADVNDHDSSGNLALHYAVREGRLETVKLLVGYDTKLLAVNDFGDDALQTAALRGHVDIMQYLLPFYVDFEKRIHAFELLGANLIDDKHDIVGGIKMWKKAMQLRYSDPNNIVYKKVCDKPNPAYGNVLEAKDLQELETIVYDPESIYMQSLLIRERILGSSHKDTTYGLMYRGAVYADTQNYQKCVDLWKYALQLRGGKDIHSHECLLTLQALAKLFWEMDSEVQDNPGINRIHFDDAVQVFAILVHYIKTTEEPTTGSRRYLHLNHEQEPLILMKLSLQLINLLQKQKPTGDNLSRFVQLVRELINMNLRDCHQKTLLHLALHKSTSTICGEPYSEMPTLETVKVLLACGADPEALDVEKNTVLIDCVNYCPIELDKNGKDILNCLLRNGSHLDSCNEHGENALDVLHRKNFPIFSLNFINLKCLASRIIVKNKINFVNQVPNSLTNFILKHG
ncbi:hypothetical protein SNE40_000803 [Patella caerulea]|uniref:Uncharacterized protein n=1 Tax=Patella caerulea TaxID=87958 RepID=A0AAN8KHX1_PATCE